MDSTLSRGSWPIDRAGDNGVLWSVGSKWVQHDAGALRTTQASNLWLWVISLGTQEKLLNLLWIAMMAAPHNDPPLSHSEQISGRWLKKKKQLVVIQLNARCKVKKNKKRTTAANSTLHYDWKHNNPVWYQMPHNTIQYQQLIRHITVPCDALHVPSRWGNSFLSFFLVFFYPMCDTQITNLSKVDTKSMQLTFLGCYHDTRPPTAAFTHNSISVNIYIRPTTLLGCCQICEKKRKRRKKHSRNVGRDD